VVSDDERSFALAINSFAGNLIGEWPAFVYRVKFG